MVLTMFPAADALVSSPDAAGLAGDLPAGLRLLIACCRRPAVAPADLAPLVRDIIDWSDFEDRVAHHRVSGFVATALASLAEHIPAASWQTITRSARRSAEQNLRNVIDEKRIDAALRARGIVPLFLKGSSLGLKLYGDLATKSSWDIDVVVPHDRIVESADAIGAIGYRPEGFCGLRSGPLFDRYLRSIKESGWHDPARGTRVDLHSRLTTYPILLAGLPRPLRRQMVVPGALGIETLDDESLFAFLCVHGSVHLWERLKWLADAVALLELTPHDPERLLAFAERVGAGRPAAATLLLCSRLFASRIDAALLQRCRSDRAVVALADAGFAMIAMDARHRRERVFDPVIAWRSHLNMVAGVRCKAGLLWSIASGLRWPFQLRISTSLWPIAALVAGPVRLAVRSLRIRRSRAPR